MKDFNGISNRNFRPCVINLINKLKNLYNYQTIFLDQNDIPV